MEPYLYVVAILGGMFAGVLNTFAGNGSAITLTILTEMIGLNGNLANGTNRVGVFFQSSVSSWTFYKHGKLKVKESWVYFLPVIIGAIAGILVAVFVSSDQFITVFRYLMIVMLVVILVNPKRWLTEGDPNFKPNYFITTPMFLALGFYGGFIQMGMGVFFLAAMVLGVKYNITKANAVKIFVVGAYTILALAIFHYRGMIDWKIGAVLASGQAFGGWAAASYASKYKDADKWAYRLLVVAIIMAIIKLFKLYTYFI